MLRRCALWPSMIREATLRQSVSKLNRMLEMQDSKATTSPEDLKQYLRTDVMSLLRGTALDRSGNGAEMRRLLGQLTRDAAFAAVVLHARPSGAFVQCIVDCLRDDRRNMRFVGMMSSAQASKIVDHLCKTGVRDPSLYPILVARINFGDLKELARVMFAFSEAGLHDQNVCVVAPLYCGERWIVINRSDTRGDGKHYSARQSNVYEAVRALRALSKSVRGYVEKQRSSGSASNAQDVLPVESINALRSALILFILQNSDALRGAHWINLARALAHFPTELRVLHGLEDSTVIMALLERDAIGSVAALMPPERRGAVTCEELAQVCITRVCDGGGRLQHSSSGENQQQQQQLRRSSSAQTHFDCFTSDLPKLLPLLGLVQDRQVREERMDAILRAVLDDLPSLTFGELVHLLQMLRQLDYSEVSALAVQQVAAEASARLAQPAGTGVERRITFHAVVQLSSALSALRVKRCDHFAEYIQRVVTDPSVPLCISVDDAVALLNGLVSTSAHTRGGVETANAIMERVLQSVRGNGLSPCLLAQYPVQAAKLLRAFVLLEAVPSLSVVNGVFGARGSLDASELPLPMNNSIAFDVARSLMHLGKLTRSSNSDVEESLWDRGCLHSLLPFVKYQSQALQSTSPQEGVPAASYVPIAWRATTEVLTSYVDAQLEHLPLERMQERLSQVNDPCMAVITSAACITADQIRVQLHYSDAPDGQYHCRDDVCKRFQQLGFSANGIVHFLSAVLMHEQNLFQAAWSARGQKVTSSSTLPTHSATGMRNVEAMKADYLAWLQTPVATGGTASPMDVIGSAFGLSGASAAGKPILDRRSAMEITTGLPFAISLVLSPGPVNEFFTEHSVPLMLQLDDDA